MLKYITFGQIARQAACLTSLILGRIIEKKNPASGEEEENVHDQAHLRDWT
jgi:hypothetical protein